MWPAEFCLTNPSDCSALEGGAAGDIGKSVGHRVLVVLAFCSERDKPAQETGSTGLAAGDGRFGEGSLLDMGLIGIVQFLALAPVAASVQAPELAVVALPSEPLAAETEEAIAIPPWPKKPAQPSGSADEAKWAEYRAASERYAAELDEVRAVRNLRKVQDEARRKAAADRRNADEAVKKGAYSIEYSLRELRSFRVLSQHQSATRLSRAENAPQLEGCTSASCLAAVQKEIDARYVVAVVQHPAETTVQMLLYREGAAQVVAIQTFEAWKSAREAAFDIVREASGAERDRHIRLANDAAERLDYRQMLEYAEIALAFDGEYLPASFAAGHAFFGLGDMRSADYRLRKALEEPAAAEEGAEQNTLTQAQKAHAWHLRGLVALRWGRQSSALEYFGNALAAGYEDFEARVMVAESLLADGDGASPAQAESHLRAALKQRPNHGKANFLMGQALRLLKRPKAAKGYLQKADAADYRRNEVTLALGLVMHAEKNDEAAIDYLSRAHDHGVQTRESVYALGAALAEREPKRAHTWLLKARRLGERSLAFELLLAQVAQRAQEMSDAKVALRRALALAAPKEAKDGELEDFQRGQIQAARHLAAIYEGESRVQDAAALWKTLADWGVDEAHGYAVQARAQQLRRRYAEARTLMEEAIGKSQGKAQGALHFELGGWLFERRRYEMAVPHLQKAAELGIKPVQSFAMWGLAAEAFRPGSGLDALTKAYDAGARDKDLLRSLARAREDNPMQRDRALPLWQDLLEVQTKDAEASFYVGRAKMRLGKVDEAEPLLTHASGHREFRGESHRLLGDLRLRQEDPKAAYEHLRLAERYLPADFALLKSLGEVAMVLDDRRAAYHYLVRALAFREDGAIAFRLGRMAFEDKRYEDAAHFVQRAMKLAYRVGEGKALLKEIVAQGQAAQAE